MFIYYVYLSYINNINNYKFNLMTLNQFLSNLPDTPNTEENIIPREIIDELNQLLAYDLHPSTLYDDLKEEPEAYIFTKDDLDQFLFKYDIQL